MKDLLNLLEVSDENLPDIYCDMDGVIVNLMKGADAVVGGSFVKHDKEERWNLINQTKGFWENLDWMPSSKRLYKFIMRYNTFILSAYSGRDPSSKNGKMKSSIKLVKRAQKQAYAKTNGEPNILIDDYIKNINEWEAKGGIGIRHTDVGKTINKLKSLGFK
mgnify:CR=1 FL=1